jgi:hypothetical protein
LLALTAADAALGVLDLVPWTTGAARPDPNGAWTAVVLSPWVDCASLTYVHAPTETRFPSFVTLGPRSTAWDWEHWWGDNPGRDWFLEECTQAPPLTEPEVEDCLRELATSLGDRRLVVLTVPEVDNGRTYAWGQPQYERHRAFNRALYRAAADCANVALADVRHVIIEPCDLHDPGGPVMFHYRRDRYRELAALVADTLAAGSTVNAEG